MPTSLTCQPFLYQAQRQSGGGGGPWNYSGSPTSMVARIEHSWRSLPKVVRILLLVQLVGYVVMLLLGEGENALLLQRYGFLSPAFVAKGWVWQLLTYPFLHRGPDLFGLLFDMLLLWQLGGIFARRWRATHFLFFYMASAVGGGIVDTLLYVALPDTFSFTMGGAIASTMGLMVAYWVVFGKQLVSLFGSRPFEARWVFYAVVFLETLTFVLDRNPHFGVSLGGLITGWLLVTGRWRPRKMRRFLSDWATQLRKKQARSRFKVVH